MADQKGPEHPDDQAAGTDNPLDALDLSAVEQQVLSRVADVVRKIQYGTVVLVIQDGKVVQIEMAEKFRMR